MLLDLDADEGHPSVGSGGKLPLGGGGHLQPVAGGQRNGLAVQDDTALAGEDAVDLLVLLVGVDKGDAGTGGELVDADLRAGETQGLKVLTDSLRQMMEDGLAYRHDYQESPPRVEYGLTELGREMLPIIDALAEFGTYYQSVVKP